MKQFKTSYGFLLAVSILTLMTTTSLISQTWEYKNSGTDFILYDLSIPAGQNDIAYAVGSKYTTNSEGVIIKTTDGGETWETIYPLSGAVNSFSKVHFITELKGFAVGWENTFLITEDGGDTWDDVAAGTNINFYSSLTFYDENVGFAGAFNNDFGIESYITTDGGLTWNMGESTNNMSVFAADFAAENIIYSVGDNLVSKSEDGGQNWQIVSTGTPGVFNLGVFFKDVTNGIISVEEGVLKVTQDGGNTWNEFSTNYHNFYGLHYIGDMLIAAGTDEDVYSSLDNGETWSIVYNGPPISTFYDIELFADGTVLICGSQGKILKVTDFILGTSGNQEVNSIEVFYTKATNEVSINSEKEIINEIKIYSIDGKLILDQSVELVNTTVLNVSYLQNGSYILIVNTNNKTQSIKFIKY